MTRKYRTSHICEYKLDKKTGNFFLNQKKTSFSKKFINEYFINASQQLNIFESNILSHFDKLFTRFAEIFVRFEISSKTFFKFKKW